MDRENFIEKVMRGEDVKLDEVLQNQAQQELDSIKSEAAQRLDYERRQRKATERRESQILELLELDAEAKKILDLNAYNERRKLEMLQEFAAREIEYRGKYFQIYSKFSQIYREVCHEIFDHRNSTNLLTQELRQRGASLKYLDRELTTVPLSPMAQKIADERSRG